MSTKDQDRTNIPELAGFSIDKITKEYVVLFYLDTQIIEVPYRTILKTADFLRKWQKEVLDLWVIDNKLE